MTPAEPLNAAWSLRGNLHLGACGSVHGMLELKKEMEQKEDWAEHQKTWVLGPILPPAGSLLDLSFPVWERGSWGTLEDSPAVRLELRTGFP